MFNPQKNYVMKKLEVTLEILETKELTTIAMIVDKSGTVSPTTTTNGDGNTTVIACCCCCC